MSDVRPLSPELEKRVLDPSGEPVGRVRELLYDKSEGRIEYVCIELTGSGRRNVEAIVPWSVVVAPGDAMPDWRVLAPKAAIERVAQTARPLEPRE